MALISTELVASLIEAQSTFNAEAEAVLIRRFHKEYVPKPKYYRVEPTPYRRLMTKIGFGASECWYWTGHVDDTGYGRMGKILGENKAHRVSYKVFKGEIPDGMKVLHSCDVRSCINPDHLSLGTQNDNVQDMISKGRWRTGDNSGEINGNSKLTWESVANIRDLKVKGSTQKSLAKLFNVSPMTISRAIRKETWK